MTLPQHVRGWSRLALHVVLLLAGVVLVQVAADRANRRLDLTPDRALTLGPIMRQVLDEVTAPCVVTVFFRRGTRERYAELLTRVAEANPRVDIGLFDLDRYPERARSVGITQYGRAAIEYQGRRVVVPALPEAELAGGFLRAVRGTSRRLLFTTGHGERAPGAQPQSYGRLASALATENYGAEGVSLLDGSLPADADLVVVAGPQRDFLPSELEVLARYLRGGGGVLVLLDPASLPNLTRFLGDLGIRIADDLLVDRDKPVLGTDGLAAVVELFKRGNPVSDPDGQPIATGAVLPSARTVDVEREVPGVRAESIARTAPTAWRMADVGRGQRGEPPSAAAHDQQGPASVMVMAEIDDHQNASRPGRLVVVGDADFASDAYFDLLGNRDLVLNAAAWVGGEAALAATRPAEVAEVMRPLSPLVLTTRQARGIFAVTVVAQPVVALLVGAIVVARRRRWG